MDEMNRREYLKQKRTEYQNSSNLEKKENALNQFLNELNNVEPEIAKIVSLNIDLGKIAKPTLINKPKEPVYTELKYKTNDEKSKVKNEIKSWIVNQKTEKILLKNQYLIYESDWIEIKTESLFRNFDLLFDKLDIIYTTLFSPENGNFLTSFEFEFEVTIYKGNYADNIICYYK